MTDVCQKLGLGLIAFIFLDQLAKSPTFLTSLKSESGITALKGFNEIVNTQGGFTVLFQLNDDTLCKIIFCHDDYSTIYCNQA